MSADHDRKFFDIFLMVLGALVAVTILIYVIAQMTGGRAQAMFISEDPAFIAMQEQRIQPKGQVAIAGRNNSGLPSAGATGSGSTAGSSTQAAMVQTAPAAATEMGGKEVYDTACSACHAAGVTGAPKLGDPAAWEARIAQGHDTLVEHAIKGFQGNAGYMPPKGGRTDLSDDAIRAAVDYMVENSG